MILPPFHGIYSTYDEDFIKEIILTYLASDILTIQDVSSVASVTYLANDCVTYKSGTATTTSTFLGLDAVSLGFLSQNLDITYSSFDVCTYDPPPIAPEPTIFLTSVIGDAEIELSWTTPYNNRCDITEYILEYTDCFLSNILTEDNVQLVAQPYSLLTEHTDTIISEKDGDLLFEPAINLITENYRSNCNYQQYDYRRILEEDSDRIIADTFLLTEQSSGIGTVNNITVQNLANNQAHIFRIAAANCAGIGEFTTTGILTPLSTYHKYCDIILFMQPNSLTDIQQSMQDYSCREKEINYIAGVSVSNISQFGLGSLYFDGQYDFPPSPATYSHLRVDSNNDTTTDDWSIYGDFTIELWLRPDNSSSSDTIMSTYSQIDAESNILNNNYWKLTRNINSVNFYIQKNDYPEYDSLSLTASNTTLPTGSFTHIAISRFHDVCRLYINGVLKDKQISSIDINIDSQFLIIGADQGNNYDISDTYGLGRGAVTNPFVGHIDDIMISKSSRYAKSSFIPAKYTNIADCDNCGGYSIVALSNTVSNEFIP